MSGTTIL
jgi:hypothetical protein